MENPPVKLLDRVRQCIRLKGYSILSEKSYVSWIRRLVLFHKKRHPRDMGKPEIEAFLSHLFLSRNVASFTRNQAFNAILFLYTHVINRGGRGVIGPLDFAAGMPKTSLYIPP